MWATVHMCLLARIKSVIVNSSKKERRRVFWNISWLICIVPNTDFGLQEMSYLEDYMNKIQRTNFIFSCQIESPNYQVSHSSVLCVPFISRSIYVSIGDPQCPVNLVSFAIRMWFSCLPQKTSETQVIEWVEHKTPWTFLHGFIIMYVS